MTELSSGNETVIVTIEDLLGISFRPSLNRLSCNELYLTLNASLISSSESVSFIFRAIIVRNSATHQHQFPTKLDLFVPGKSIVPLLSASTSLIMSCSSDSEGFWPRDRITVPSSFVVICPVQHHCQRGQCIAPFSLLHFHSG